MYLKVCRLQYLAVALCLATAGTALAQKGGGGRSGGPGFGSRGGFGRRGGDFGGMRRDIPASPTNADRNGVGASHGSLQVGPPGRWWDDKHFARDLKLRPEQQQRMDEIFEQNRGPLLKSYESLRFAGACGTRKSQHAFRLSDPQ
jgi:hypothetical protein